jgi:glycosyltransferase involved in cell wall biosynthesis
MDYKKGAKKIARGIPGAKKIVVQQEIIAKQAEEIKTLRKNLVEHEKRQERWAQEVRELRGDNKRLGVVWPVFEEDIIAADWRNPRKNPPYKKHKPPFTLNWVIPPMGPVSGGHADIFRAICYLEKQGHTCRIYFYDALKQHRLADIKKNLNSYAPIKSELFYNAKEMAAADAIIATNWFSAYPVYNYKGSAKKFYFVQDFEPFFEPVGSYSTFAANTYKFGFHGITLGEWLSKKLSKEYGMKCDFIQMGTDVSEYKFTNTEKRKKILYYARPVTPRRGFELGSLALSIFNKKHPEYEIHCLGWDLSRYDLPFPFVNRGILNAKELNELYNECAAGLVLSFTNMSLLPLELMASGCIPVLNDAEHTRMVPFADQLAYSDPSPNALAKALSDVVTDSKLPKRAQAASEYAQKFQWNNSNYMFEKILLNELAS